MTELFTYHRNAPALRSHLAMLRTLLLADAVLFAVLGIVLPRPWNWTALAGGALLVGLAFWFLGRVMRTTHTLTAGELVLHFGRFRLTVPRDTIAGADLHTGPLPRGLAAPTMPPAYRAETDTLYLLADRKGLVTIRLNRPLSARTSRQGTVEFTRVTLSLDQPDRFIAALTGADSSPAAPPVIDTAAGSLPLLSTAARQEGAAIHLAGLHKQFGDFTAVQDVTLTVAPGEVLAFLGSNGAGKTTTIRMMVGLLRPTGGQVLIEGQDLWSGGPAVRRLVGYVPDVPLLYERLTAREFLWLMAGLYGLPEAEGRRRTEELLALLKLDRWHDSLIRSFSLGMKRKMAIAAALIHRPRVLLLDEVTNGLDPRATREVKDLILEAARGGTAIFLTTHLLDLATELAQRVAIIHRGEIRAMGDLADLREQAGRPQAGLEELFLTFTTDGVTRQEVSA